jgi:hypothetical protein
MYSKRSKQDILNRLKYKNTRKNAFNDLKRILSANTHNVENAKLYNCINYIASHTYYFSNDEYKEIAHLALSNNTITNKQKANIRSRVKNRKDNKKKMNNLLAFLDMMEKLNTDSCVYDNWPDNPNQYLLG